MIYKQSVKIVLIIHSLGIGGMERVMATLANYLASQKETSIHLLLIGRKRNIEYQLSKKIFIYRPNFIFDNRKRLWHTLLTTIFIRKTVKVLSPDVVLSFGEVWNNLVLLALLNVNIPVYISERCQPGKNLGKLHNFLRKITYKNAKGIIAQTQKAKEFFQEELKHKNVEVIGNPIRFIPNNETLVRKNEVLTVGRLIQSKHHDRLIRLFSEIRQQDWVLRIVGGDALKQSNKVKLQALINELSANNYIFLEGETNSIDTYYQQAKIFGFTSSSEGFPNVIGEALSASLPVISYNCLAGPSDMIQNGMNGYLIEQFDDESFKKQLKKLMEDDSLRSKMGEEARKSIQRFDPERISHNFYAFITSHLSNSYN